MSPGGEWVARVARPRAATVGLACDLGCVKRQGKSSARIVRSLRECARHVVLLEVPVRVVARTVRYRPAHGVAPRSRVGAERVGHQILATRTYVSPFGPDGSAPFAVRSKA